MNTMRSKTEKKHVLTGKCEGCNADLVEKHGEVGKLLRRCIDCPSGKQPKLTLSGLPKNAKGWA